MVLPLPFGVKIYIDGVAVVPETGLGPSLPPRHPDAPDVPRNIRYTASASELRLTWEAPLDWGNEENPSGLPRRYLLRWRTDHHPDDSDDETTGLAYTIDARGATEVTLLGITAENAARRRSHEVLLPVPIHFRVYSRKYGPQYGRQYA